MLRIKEICKQQGITVATIAERTGIFAPTLSRINNGGNTTTETLEKIAAALNVPITELFARPSTDVIICPNCGIELEIKVKEQS
jgi:transcriptional regulator with XRE-family HTH domain